MNIETILLNIDLVTASAPTSLIIFPDMNNILKFGKKKIGFISIFIISASIHRTASSLIQVKQRLLINFAVC